MSEGLQPQIQMNAIQDMMVRLEYVWLDGYTTKNLRSKVRYENWKLDTLLEYAVQNKYDDLFTVDNKGTRNGSVRIMKKEFVESGEISRRVGSYVDNCTNVHSEQDLIDAEANIEVKQRLYELGNQGE